MLSRILLVAMVLTGAAFAHPPTGDKVACRFTGINNNPFGDISIRSFGMGDDLHQALSAACRNARDQMGSTGSHASVKECFSRKDGSIIVPTANQLRLIPYYCNGELLH